MKKKGFDLNDNMYKLSTQMDETGYLEGRFLEGRKGLSWVWYKTIHIRRDTGNHDPWIFKSHCDSFVSVHRQTERGERTFMVI